MGLPLFVQRIADALTDSGILVHAIRRDMTVILSAAGKGGHRADFIVLDPAARTPDEAFRDSGIISHLLRAHIRPRPAVIVRDLWERHPEMMKERMLAHCGIFTPVFARNCEVRRISRPEADSFLEMTHSYGGAASRYCYGLFIKNIRNRNIRYGMEIPEDSPVAVAEFSNARRWIKGDRKIRSYEWIRYASLPGMRISGGMGKILKHFISDVAPDDIMSYADLEWSDGSVYRQLGFSEDGFKDPVLFSIDRSDWTRTPLGRSISPACHSATPSHCHSEPPSACHSEPPSACHSEPPSDCHSEPPSACHSEPPSACHSERSEESATPPISYYRNLGSIKFRLKLTDY